MCSASRSAWTMLAAAFLLAPCLPSFGVELEADLSRAGSKDAKRALIEQALVDHPDGCWVAPQACARIQDWATMPYAEDSLLRRVAVLAPPCPGAEDCVRLMVDARGSGWLTDAADDRVVQQDRREAEREAREQQGVAERGATPPVQGAATSAGGTDQKPRTRTKTKSKPQSPPATITTAWTRDATIVYERATPTSRILAQLAAGTLVSRLFVVKPTVIRGARWTNIQFLSASGARTSGWCAEAALTSEPPPRRVASTAARPGTAFPWGRLFAAAFLGFLVYFAVRLTKRVNALSPYVPPTQAAQFVEPVETGEVTNEAVYLDDDDGEWIEVVGESRYRENLYSIFGRHEDGIEEDAEAVLVREPDNRHDPNAVRVDIAGLTVGYLSRNMAPEVHACLIDGTLKVPARVRGGFRLREDDRGRSWADFGVEVCIPTE